MVTVAEKLYCPDPLQLAAVARLGLSIVHSVVRTRTSEALEVARSLKAGVWPGVPRLARCSQLAARDPERTEGMDGPCDFRDCL